RAPLPARTRSRTPPGAGRARAGWALVERLRGLAGRAAGIARRGGRAPLCPPRLRGRHRIGGARPPAAADPGPAGRGHLGRARAPGVRPPRRGGRAPPGEGGLPLALPRPAGAALPGPAPPLGPAARERGGLVARVARAGARVLRAPAGRPGRRRP